MYNFKSSEGSVTLKKNKYIYAKIMRASNFSPIGYVLKCWIFDLLACCRLVTRCISLGYCNLLLGQILSRQPFVIMLGKMNPLLSFFMEKKSRPSYQS